MNSQEKTQVRILLDEMFGCNFERFFISAANNAGLGETALLRANEPEFITPPNPPKGG